MVEKGQPGPDGWPTCTIGQAPFGAANPNFGTIDPPPLTGPVPSPGVFTSHAVVVLDSVFDSKALAGVLADVKATTSP